MKKNIPWQALLTIGLVGAIVGRFIGGVVGDAVGVLGDICLLIGIANMIVALIKKRKEKKAQTNTLSNKIIIKSEKVEVDKKSKIDYFKYFAKYAPFIVIIVLIVIIAIFINNKSGLKNTEQNQDKQGGKEFLFRKQTECMNICQAIYENHKKLLLTIGTVFSPKYAYNESKNACFYSGGWVDSLASNTKLVINCQTNEEVLIFETDRNGKVVRDCNTCVDSFEEYSRREKEYMENAN
ncbi:MAG: hypothetical protein WCK16_01910 [Candidatus Moraniibacteriota bacterium]